MPTNLDRYQQELNALGELGAKLIADLHARHLEETGQRDKAKVDRAKAGDVSFELGYQAWYTEARAVVKQLIPDRLKEFDELYKGDGKQKRSENGTDFSIQDWLNGTRAATNLRTGEKRFNDMAAAFMRLVTQTQVFAAARRRLDSSLFDIRGLVQADLLDSEIGVAGELSKHGFLRAAGAVAGVALEKHLAQVVANHNLVMKKRHPTIADLNDSLREGGVVDLPTWRFIQRLADVRNLTTHNKDREPTGDEVGELLIGVDKVAKTVS